MRSSAAARRYARALFALAREKNRVAEIRGELDAMARLLEDHPALAQSLFRPLHAAAERRRLLRAVCGRVGSSDTVRNFCSYLIDQRRLVDFPVIREQFGRLADDAEGRTRAEVVCASPLRDEQRDRLRRALAARTGLEVELSVRVDPSLIGGAIATVGGVVFDGSLHTQLWQLRGALTRGQ
jgi:F-type H+-transporting ATPase subunit delta